MGSSKPAVTCAKCLVSGTESYRMESNPEAQGDVKAVSILGKIGDGWAGKVGGHGVLSSACFHGLPSKLLSLSSSRW